MKRKLLILALAVGLIGGILATAGVAAQSSPVDVARGHLYLDTSGEGNFSVHWYDDGAATPTRTQTLNVDSKCNVALSGPKLIAITPTGGTFGTGIGAVSHGLGVKTKNNCATAQGKIEINQSLTIALGEFFGDGVLIKTAEVDVEGKRNAKLGVNYLPGVGETIVLSNTSDNGPDSGTGDNNIVVLDPGSPFRAVEFFPVAGGTNDPAVAIEGGGDGPLPRPEGTLRQQLGTNASVFELVETYDGILDCGDPTFLVGGDTDEMSGIFTRLLNRTNPEVCTPKPYNLNVTFSGEFGSTVLFDPEGAEAAAYWGEVSSPDKPAAQPDRIDSPVRP